MITYLFSFWFTSWNLRNWGLIVYRWKSLENGYFMSNQDSNYDKENPLGFLSLECKKSPLGVFFRQSNMNSTLKNIFICLRAQIIQWNSLSLFPIWGKQGQWSKFDIIVTILYTFDIVYYQCYQRLFDFFRICKYLTYYCWCSTKYFWNASNIKNSNRIG